MYRTIDTRFWTDPKVRQLNTNNKLLFLYFITSPHAHFSGIYYLPKTTTSHETGIRLADVTKGIDTLSMAGIVMADTLSELIWVVNMFRYQSHSEKLLKGIANHLGGLHNSALIGDFLEHYSALEIPYQYPIAALSDKEQEKEQRKEQGQDEEQDKPAANDFTDTDSIIDYLNEKVGSGFRHSEASRKNIGARLAESFTADDCRLVIDFKCVEWIGTEFDKYLTPETLFRPSKFENNLNAAKRWDQGGRVKNPSSNGTGKSQKDKFGMEPPTVDYLNVGKAEQAAREKLFNDGGGSQ
jgi:uncharacterized phage protein (TIGR02220 family)